MSKDDYGDLISNDVIINYPSGTHIFSHHDSEMSLGIPEAILNESSEYVTYTGVKFNTVGLEEILREPPPKLHLYDASNYPVKYSGVLTQPMLQQVELAPSGSKFLIVNEATFKIEVKP